MKNLKLLFFLIIGIFMMLAVNAQQDCFNAEHIPMDYYSTCGLMALGNVTLEGAVPTPDVPSPGCGNFNVGTNDIWYTIIVPAGVTELAFHAINAPPPMPGFPPLIPGSPAFNPGMAVYSGNCTNLNLLNCWSDNGGMMENGEIRFEVISGLTPGQVLYIRLWDQDNNEVDFFFAASVRTEMEEHNCDTPAEMTSGGCNILAPRGEIQAPDDCGWTSTDNTVYYYFTVEAGDEQPVVIEVENGECWNNEGGGMFPIDPDPQIQLALYSWNGVNCNGIGGSPSSDPPNNSTYYGCNNGTGTVSISANLPPGQYMLAMDGFSSDAGWSLCTYGISASFIEEELIVELNTIDATCGESGSATVYIVNSCTGDPTIEWSTGQTGTTIDDLDPGNYSVTISDGDDCEDVIHNFTIENNDDFSVTIVVDGDECSEFITLTAQISSGDPANVSFTWNTTPPQTGPSIDVYESGTYSVNAVYGTCEDSDQTSVTVMDVPDATIDPAGPFCNTDAPVNLTAATPGGTWSGTGITNPTNGTFDPGSANLGENEITYTVGEGDCEGVDMIIINVYDTPDATITPAGPFCANDAAVTLSAASPGGTWSGPGIINASTGTFDPGQADSGDNIITYEVGITGCDDTDQITITVIDEIVVQNFTDNICNPELTEYFVTFSVVYSGGGGASFYVDSGTGAQLYNNNYSGTFPSGTAYSITVTDENGCNEYYFDGETDCGCLTYAGTMSTLETQNLCADECTDMIGHNGDEVLAPGDIFQYILHSGGYPATVLARNDTPEFCFSDIVSLEFEVTYYVSAVAGPPNAQGNVDPTDNCYSQSAGTPVIWYNNPIAFINSSTQSICGLEATLNAFEPQPGNTGVWTADVGFVAINGTNINSPSIHVSAFEYTSATFTWSVSNGVCAGSDQVMVHFLQTPTAYAGEDFTICGNEAELEAVYSLSGATGQWSGAGGSFNPQTSPTSTVSVSNFGPHYFTWRETNSGLCWDEDMITVNFIPDPQPTIPNPYDTVCGISYTLNVSNVNHPGQWTAYEDGEVLSPAPNYSPSINSPNASVTIGNYDGLSRTIEFVWTETSQSGGVECEGEAIAYITFSKKPIASVGPINEDEICGNCITFNADTTGSGWANGRWISQDVIVSFEDDNPYIPDASLCIEGLGAYGDSAHVRAPFIWVMENYGCQSLDTMWVTFYRQPVANAGLNDSICGNNYELGAVFNFPESPSYNPIGLWTVHTRPDPSASADIDPANSDSVSVTVSHYGEWVFQFRENNAFLSSCYSTDTVIIRFLEIPVVDAGEDRHVCGPTTELEGVTAGFSGTWLPNGVNFVDFSDPTTSVQTNTYGAIDFIWSESNSMCSSRDTVQITFWRIPQAEILTDAEDSTACGYTFNRLRANTPSSGITGFWWNDTDADADFLDVNNHNTSVTVSTYGYHDFYWIASNGPSFMPGFCNDTAGPLTIHFIEIPIANGGGDTLFCGYSGQLNAIPSVGTGVWSTPSSALVSFEDQNDPNTEINSQVLNTGNASYPHFNLIWTEDNTNGCTDKDTIKVIFARIPNSTFNIVPPKCFGEPATLSAVEDSLQQYQWNFYTGVIDSTVNNEEFNANYEHFVYWTGQDTSHRVTLIVTNHWGCNSAITIDTVYEPPIPDFDVIIVQDTCLLGRGGIIFEDTIGTNAFYWIDPEIGPNPGTPITAVYNLPEGEYDIRARYRTTNQDWYNYYIATFGNAMCTDTITYNIEPIGLIEAEFDIPLDILVGELVAPEAEVTFNNNSDYGGVRRRCIWNFDDGNTMTSCDDQVIHTYTEAGCYYPFLIVMNRDLQECRDTAKVDICIEIDNASSLEIPNIFTPNGDGINDFFQVKAQTLREFQGHIVNRWGNVVYEWTNWQDEEAGWDGKLSGGTKASTGVYFYIIKAIGMDDEPYDEHGTLHLIRD
jgi:gliding motility-associated-like protein